MHSSNSPCPRPEDVGLAVPPDLPDDPFPLLQSLRPLQLLGRSEHVHAQRPVWLAGVVADGDFRAWQQHGRLYVVPIVVVVVVLALLVLLADVLQVFLLGRGGGDVGAWLAGDADDQEAERQHQAETHPKHEVKAKALRVCWGKRTNEQMEFSAITCSFFG